MAITKCLIGMAAVKLFTAALKALRQCGRTATDGPRWLAWRRSMSKCQTSCDRCLTDAELDGVSGGVASVPAYIHHVFGGSASDLLFGGKGLVADVAYDAAMDYLRGH
jgi:hypothetical protein